MPRRAMPLWLAFAALCAGHLLLRTPYLSLPMMSDEGEYAYQAWIMEEGGVPYRDAYNQKPPLAFFLYRAARAVLGGSESAPRLLAAASTWLAMLFLLLSTPGSWPAPVRLAAPAFYGSLSALPVGDLGLAAHPEVFASTLLAGAAWLLAAGRGALAAGLFAGAALTAKQTALWPAAALCGWLAWASRGLRGPFAFAAGAAAVPALAWLYFLARGGASDLWDQVVSRNMDYASAILGTGQAGPQIRWLAGSLAPLLLAGAWPACLLAAAGLAAVRPSRERAAEVLVTAWLGGTLVGAATGLLFFPHYFIPALAPLSLAAAFGLARLSRRWRMLSSPAAVAALAAYPALAHLPSFLCSGEELARRLLHPNPLYEAREAAEFIRARTAPGEPIYVFGSEPQIYVYSGRRPPSRHDFVYPLTLFPRDPIEVRRELDALEAAGPRLIAVVDLPGSTLVATRLGLDFERGVRSLLDRRYRPVHAVPIRESPHAIVIFERTPPAN